MDDNHEFSDMTGNVNGLTMYPPGKVVGVSIIKEPRTLPTLSPTKNGPQHSERDAIIFDIGTKKKVHCSDKCKCSVCGFYSERGEAEHVAHVRRYSRKSIIVRQFGKIKRYIKGLVKKATK